MAGHREHLRTRFQRIAGGELHLPCVPRMQGGTAPPIAKSRKFCCPLNAFPSGTGERTRCAIRSSAWSRLDFALVQGGYRALLRPPSRKKIVALPGVSKMHPPIFGIPLRGFASAMVSVDAPTISLAYQTTTEPLICLIRTPACRHDTCGLPRQPDSSAFRLALWKNIGFTAPVPPIAKSAPASSTRSQISTHGPISAPKPPPATPASARCCRQSGTLPFPMQEKSGADP